MYIQATNPFPSTIIKTITLVSFSILFVYVAFKAIDTAASRPDAYFSHATGECVKVVNYAEGDNYSCENLPKRFYYKHLP